jgi:hypothetical protein
MARDKQPRLCVVDYFPTLSVSRLRTASDGKIDEWWTGKGLDCPGILHGRNEENHEKLHSE